MADRIAVPLADARWEAGPAIHGHDPSIMDQFRFDHHITRALEDLHVVVVAGLKYWRTIVRPSQTACAQRPAFRTVELVPPSLRALIGDSLASLGGLWGNGPLWANDH